MKLPWRRDVLEADLATYASRGIRHVTSFAVYVDADYRRRYGEPGFIGEYGNPSAGSCPDRDRNLNQFGKEIFDEIRAGSRTTPG